MVLDEVLFHEFTEYSSKGGVVIGRGERLGITKIGKISFLINSQVFTLNKVLCVPRLSKTLISSHRLCDDLKCYIKLTSSNFVVKDLKTHLILFSRNSRGRLYYFTPDKQCNIGIKASTNICHRRLGHPSLKILKKLGHVLDIDSLDNEMICNDCPMAKMSQLSFPFILR